MRMDVGPGPKHGEDGHWLWSKAWWGWTLALVSSMVRMDIGPGSKHGEDGHWLWSKAW